MPEPLQNAPCENHADRAATHVAAMKSPTQPYDREVPLCAECAPRIERIGFAVTPIEPLPWPEGADDGDYVRHPDADKFTAPTWEIPGRCICGAELPPEKDWNDAGRDWAWVKCSVCPRGYVDEETFTAIYDVWEDDGEVDLSSPFTDEMGKSL